MKQYYLATWGKISNKFDAWIAEKRNLEGLVRIRLTTDTLLFPSASKAP